MRDGLAERPGAGSMTGCPTWPGPLVIGSGGREHALAWKLAQSPRVREVFCAPGNAGIAGTAQCVDIGATDIERLLSFAREVKIDLIQPGPQVRPGVPASLELGR